MDIDVGLTMSKLSDLFFKLFNFGALLTDNDTGSRGMNIDFSLIRRPFDFDARNAGVIKPGFKKLFNAKIFMQKLRIVMARKPLGIPGFDDAEAKQFWMRFLTHLEV